MNKIMFDPLPKSGDTNVVPLQAPEWRVLMPVPESASVPPAKHPKLGAPAMRWEYRDDGGRLLGLVCRFETKTGGKEIRSLVFGEHPKWGRQWRWLSFPKPHPLYGLDRLAARRDAPVMACEGEKSADAAAKLLPDYVAITSPGGSKAATAADWSPLSGRRVVIWPDADEPGQAYARAVVAELAKLSSTPSVAVIKPPEGAPEGWDAADALAEGWDRAKAAALIATAAPAPGWPPRRPAPDRLKAKDCLLELIGEVELWHDPERKPYVTIPVNGHFESCELKSEDFKDLLADQTYEATGTVPANETIDAALRIARVRARRGPCHKTWNRVAEHNGKLYLDLGDQHYRAIEITPDGWQVVTTVPVKFLRSPGMEALPDPEGLISAEPGEAIDLLRKFVNVESDADFRLLVTWLAATLRPAGPYPVLVLTGQQGAAKSTTSRVCRRLIDPNVSPIRAVPKDDRDLMIAADNAWMLNFDNLSNVPAWLSDAFCRLSTGGGFSTRQLHSDRGETLFAAVRPIVLNGIGDLAERPDLADRALTVQLPPLPEDKRREERAFWADFDKALPVILGGLLDGVVCGLRDLPGTKLNKLPRMADFARWGAACAPAFGWSPADFLSDYADNRAAGEATAVEAAPLLPLIERVLACSELNRTGFSGTASELLVKLVKESSEEDRKARWFPKTAAKLGSDVRRIAPLLASRNIIFRERKASDRNKTRLLTLRRDIEKDFNEIRARLIGHGSDGGKGGADDR